MNTDKRRLSLLLLALLCIVSITCAIEASASAGSVTGYKKITWGISTGRYYVNGTHAFCAQYNKSWPTVGTEVKEIVPCTNDILRKALYYGYNGPENTLGTDERAHVLTAVAVSDANIGESATGASAKYDAFYWELVNNPSKYPSPPSNFKAYLAITASDAMQNLAFYEMEKNGYVTGIKKSSNTQLNNGNACYSLAGAQYGIYSSADTNEGTRVGTLTMDANGKSNTVELVAGSYYVRENVAPKGYAKSSEVTQFTITPEQTTTLNFSDVPQTNPIDILIKKVDAETNKSEAQGNATLENAHFKVCYYAGIWETDKDPATFGEKPKRTWMFRTDEQGIVRYKKEYLISGDELYEAMPLGTLVIQETKASEGYLLNETTFVRQITSNSDSKHVSTYQAPIVPEKVIEVHVTKYQSDTEVTIPGTVFEHASPSGSRSLHTTDEKGKLVLKGLEYGEHTLWEISVMDGYVISDAIYRFTVDEETREHLQIAVYDNPAPYHVVIQKKDCYDNKLSGAEFTMYEDAECQIEVKRGVTNEEGILYLNGLEIGKRYYLKETKAPGGYEITKDENGDVHVYEIYVESTPVKDEFTCYVDGEKYENIAGTKANREVQIEVINDVGHVRPKTGSYAALLVNLTGMALCGMSLYLNKKEKKQEKGEKKE